MLIQKCLLTYKKVNVILEVYPYSKTVPIIVAKRNISKKEVYRRCYDVCIGKGDKRKAGIPWSDVQY